MGVVGDGGGSTPQFFVHSEDRTTFTGDFRHPISTSFSRSKFFFGFSREGGRDTCDVNRNNTITNLNNMTSEGFIWDLPIFHSITPVILTRFASIVDSLSTTNFCFPSMVDIFTWCLAWDGLSLWHLLIEKEQVTSYDMNAYSRQWNCTPKTGSSKLCR